MSGVDAPVDEIKPPPKVLAMIEKTAKFVVKNGPKFEERIKKQNATKSIAEQARFAFLDENHVYNKYYRDLIARKVAEESEGASASSISAETQISKTAADGKAGRAADDTDAARNKRAGVAVGGDLLSARATARAAMIDILGQTARAAQAADSAWAEHKATRQNESLDSAEPTAKVALEPPPPRLQPPAPLPHSYTERTALLLAAQLAAIGGREAVARAAARAAREAADGSGSAEDRSRRQRRAELLRLSLQQSSPFHPSFRDVAAAYSACERVPAATVARWREDVRDPWRNAEVGTGGMGVLARAARRGATRRRESAARDERRQAVRAGWRVDWQDFVVVQTLDDEWEEELPAPEPLKRASGELAPAAVHDTGGPSGSGGGGSGGSRGGTGLLSEEAMARALAAARRRKAVEEAQAARAAAPGRGEQASTGDGTAESNSGRAGAGDGGTSDVEMDDDEDDDEDAMDMDEEPAVASSRQASARRADAATAKARARASAAISPDTQALGPTPQEMAGNVDDEEIRVVDDYALGSGASGGFQRSTAATASGGTGVFVDPKTGERVPVRGVQEALRIGLIDQRTYQEQQKKEKEKKSTSSLVPDEMIGDSLIRMGRQRTDIFGGSSERADAEAAAASAKAMDTTAGGGVWDGQIASIDQLKQQQGMSGSDGSVHRPSGAGGVGSKRPGSDLPDEASSGTQQGKRPRNG